LEEALEILRDQFVINRDDLRKKYPLGYALFYIDRKEIFAPYDVPESKNIQISFDKTKLLAFSKDRILIGDFFIADLKNHIILSDLTQVQGGVADRSEFCPAVTP
jgi:hypothetical protein